ncbi:UDP-N-acetylmuramoyl-L-alanyl-D-glutamate--2,6-diaminopimelate ligase MurE homolog, chloroplastic [Amaranthus tricolor]|uniref:UDP-N-acetylmuramoyl-L-alanyl-D-glutamate--2, 6-diaminopimelate ligase MurE homolog, chloroplastic n=1 Tax=Amaranthus tricolor TaxID=29722 RepID=UPI002582F591|nr:UDP-N-acetylmuramoyl-L-alanyl-D-glutamate--2,6-diaminopimelate ligase MurE homolog, chloroplastic [Amaranthus tricolor]
MVFGSPMSLQPFLTLPLPVSSSLSLHSTSSSTHFPKPILRPFFSLIRPKPISAAGNSYPSPSSDDPPEAPEDTAHGVSKFRQIQRQASRARKLEEEDFLKNRSVFLDAIKDVEDAPDNEEYSTDVKNSGDDLFGEIDKAIAQKRKDFVKQGLLKPNPPKKSGVEVEEEEEIDILEPEEVVDLEEIDELRGLKVVDEGEREGEEEGTDGDDYNYNGDEVSEISKNSSNLFDDFNFDSFGNNNKVRIVEPKFKMTLAELLDECKVVPISVYGDLEIEISGIEHDSRLVNAGDLFVCCVGNENETEIETENDGHLYLNEADKRGAVAVVASKEIDIQETLGCKALVLVEDTYAALPALAAAFFRSPTKNMSVIGITGTHGKTTTSFLIKSMYEAMGLRTGLMSSVAYYVHGDNKLESPEGNPDAVLVQKLMAKMLHNGTEAVVMEASSKELAQGRCEEVDFDIAVFTNLSRDHSDFQGSEEEYRLAQAKLFSRMVDRDRQRKIVNIDDENAPFFIAQGNPDVPVLTFSLENKDADVHPLKFELSLFETTILVNTPQGILEISSGLLGRHNIYNILAAVAVGIAVGAPLEDIVRGIEEVDAVPGRCELIDEEQAFGVIVDHARTPDALSRLLDSVRELKPRRIITVIGSCGDNERGKRPMLTKIATDKSDVTMLTSDNPGSEDPLDILDDMLAGVGWTMQDYLKHGENDYYPPLPNGHRLFLHDIRRVAVRCAVAMGEEGDMVVVAGKGHEAYQIEGEKSEFFDDREECREALQYVDELHQAGIDTSEFPWRLPESH